MLLELLFTVGRYDIIFRDSRAKFSLTVILFREFVEFRRTLRLRRSSLKEMSENEIID